MNDLKNSAPRVTVLLPVYNGAAYLKPAIESILNQSFSDFELLIINDGSQDNSASIIAEFQDARIRFVNNEHNIGLIATLNKGLALSQTELIARMDQDDVALPERLKLQVAAFESDPNLVVCGTNYNLIKGSRRYFRPSSQSGSVLKAQLLFTSCFSHPTVMMKHPLKFHGVQFESEFLHCEDYRFWTRLAPYGNFKFLPQALLDYRIHEQQITSKFRQEQFAKSAPIRRDYLQHLGFKINEVEETLLNRIGNHERWQALTDLKAIDALFQLILSQNTSTQTLEQQALKQVLVKNWVDCCGHSTLGLAAFGLCLRSNLMVDVPLSLKEKTRLLIKCLLRKVW